MKQIIFLSCHVHISLDVAISTNTRHRELDDGAEAGGKCELEATDHCCKTTFTLVSCRKPQTHVWRRHLQWESLKPLRCN